jgi:hypothetical protein
MADENPTYRVEPFGDTEKYTCLVSDAGHADGICGHWATDKELFEQHMHQRHAGVMVAEAPAQSPRASQDETQDATPDEAQDATQDATLEAKE